MQSFVRLVVLLPMFGSALLFPVPAAARPVHKQALADHFGPHLARRLNDCRTCHVPATGGDEDDKPHNPFGARLAVLRDESSRARGKPDEIPGCLDAILDEDSDGDGFSNRLELLAGRSPGEADDRPTAEETAAADKQFAAWRKFRAGYAWRPFETPRRPPVPQVRNVEWVRNPIDAFLAARHEELGLTPRPEAPRPLLVRRVHLDLIGLPPTRDELADALADPSPDWYEKLVDRLLASPRHGERWGRHWMDVWRYSDWSGYAGQIRHSHPHVWRWRDWIVESVNADKTYDRMILEMLAGDEIAPDDPDTVRATGFLVRNYHGIPAARDKWLQDTVDHTFQGLLGLSIGCARCHDHMYDPLTQRDYYAIRAFFEPHRVRIDHMPGDSPRIDLTNGFFMPGNGLSRAFDNDVAAPTYLYVRGDETKPDKSAAIPPGVPVSLGGTLPEIVPVPLPESVYDPERRDVVVRDLVAADEAAIAKVEEKLAKADQALAPVVEAELAAAKAKLAATLAVLAADRFEQSGRIDSEEGKQAATEALRAQRQLALLEARRNVATARHELLDPKTKAAATTRLPQFEKQLAKAEADEQLPLSTAYAKRPVKTYPKESTGRRLALARWIAHAENPLTARVAMNHLWLRHFGQAIVPRTFDFGRNGGARPEHPALLDWLACEFTSPSDPRSGPPWSMKRMHRLAATSTAYRMASTPDEANAAIDRDNAFFWRQPSRRMEAEVVRDSLFHLAGSLDFAMGGLEIEYAKGMTVPRRSIYFRHAQEHQMEFLKIFDTASVVECYERTTSVVPHQALALANSDLPIRQARLAARRLHERHGEPEAFVQAAFELVLSRPPAPEERTHCVAFLVEQAALYPPLRTPQPAPASVPVPDDKPAPDPHLRARENLVRVLVNHNDFVTIR